MPTDMGGTRPKVTCDYTCEGQACQVYWTKDWLENGMTWSSKGNGPDGDSGNPSECSKCQKKKCGESDGIQGELYFY
jgi:hypothetical protein